MPAVNIPSFIPKLCPKDCIVDYGHNLTKDEVQDLSKTCSNFSYSPKVIILPKSYLCQNLDDLAIALAKNWHLRGHGLLMVIDLRSAKVKVITSKFLHENYIDNDFLKQNILKKEFLPNVKEGNLYLAIKNSLKAINNKIENIKLTSNHIVQSSDTTYNSAINSAPSPSPTNYNNGFSGFGILPYGYNLGLGNNTLGFGGLGYNNLNKFGWNTTSSWNTMNAMNTMNTCGFSHLSTPMADVLEMDDQFLLEIALPGVVLDDVELKIEGNYLVVIAKRTPAMFEERALVLRKEMPAGYLVREFEFDTEIIAEQIEARFDRGILYISVPKLEIAHRIPVSAGTIESHIPTVKTRINKTNETLRSSKEIAIK